MCIPGGPLVDDNAEGPRASTAQHNNIKVNTTISISIGSDDDDGGTGRSPLQEQRQRRCDDNRRTLVTRDCVCAVRDTVRGVWVGV